MWTWKRPNYLLVSALVGLVALLGVGCGHSTGGPYERAVALLNDYPLIDGYMRMYCMRVQGLFRSSTGINNREFDVHVFSFSKHTAITTWLGRSGFTFITN